MFLLEKKTRFNIEQGRAALTSSSVNSRSHSCFFAEQALSHLSEGENWINTQQNKNILFL
tara:strand:+ start:255 stop:434 length:180 start_codon:yes stop_codon:yes gene_type:complete